MKSIGLFAEMIYYAKQKEVCTILETEDEALRRDWTRILIAW